MTKRYSFDIALLRWNLKVAMAVRGHSQRMLAAEIGIPHSAVSMQLGGRNQSITADNAVRFMAWLGHHDIRRYSLEEAE